MRNKKGFTAALVLLLVLALTLSGCGGKKEETPQTSAQEPAPAAEPEKPAPEVKQEPEPEPGIHVSTARELLETIGSDKEILIEPGVYDLSAAAKELYNEDQWYDMPLYLYDGGDAVEVAVDHVDNLVIRGSARGKVELTTPGEYCDVLRFEGCTNVTLANVTMGHSGTVGVCTGDVVETFNCKDITLEDLDLYGCGAYAVTVTSSTGVHMNGCTLRECSYGALAAYSSTDVQLDGCTLRDNTECYYVIDGLRSQIDFKDCTLSGNEANWSIFSESGNSILAFEGCTFGEWETEQVAGLNASVAAVFDEDCTFTRDGVTRFSSVKDVEGLVNAIRPGAVIFLEDGEYNVSQWAEKASDSYIHNRYVYVEPVYDGYELRITGVDGLTIRSRSGDRSKVKLITEPRYANVLGFEDCSNVALSGFTAGHTDTGDCAGDVLYFTSSDRVIMEDLDLYGCGVYGIGAWESGDISIFNSTIRDCEYGCVELYGCYNDITFQSCILKDNRGQPGIGEEDYDFLSLRDCVFGEEESEAFAYMAFNHSPYFEAEDCVWAEGYEPGDLYGEYEGIDGPEGIENLSGVSGTLDDFVGTWTGYWYGVPESGYETALPTETEEGEPFTASLEIDRDSATYFESGSETRFEVVLDELNYTLDMYLPDMEEGPCAAAWLLSDGEDGAGKVLAFTYGEIMLWLRRA